MPTIFMLTHRLCDQNIQKRIVCFNNQPKVSMYCNFVERRFNFKITLLLFKKTYSLVIHH